MTTIRRRPADRVTGALWGALVAGVGSLMIATFSGYTIDLELAGIVALAALGGWLVMSAVMSGKPRERAVFAPAPVDIPAVREPHLDTPPSAKPKAAKKTTSEK
ncbi:MAG: hypothetical protein CVT64_09395 [Actinobacteria bacterium HGW-Actinobacteria-4]|nr:MAG: hypothetical protein CVT64_09395 [Actinobacteria bacterium HGW-Actinobacteria-4]